MDDRMDVNDLKGLNAEVKKRMDGAIEHVEKGARRRLRSGRASVSLLDPVHVEAYGTSMPLNQVASLSVPEPTLIVAQPFDPSLMTAIERGIQKANLGLNPASDGKVCGFRFRPLTEERRKEMSRLVHKHAEEGRNAVRQVRRDANDRLKKLLKDHKISEDDERRALDEVQKITDQHVGMIDDCRRRRTRNCWASRLTIGYRDRPHLRVLPSRMPCGAGPFDPREIHHLCSVRRALPARPLRPDRRAEMVETTRSPGERRCGGIAS